MIVVEYEYDAWGNITEVTDNSGIGLAVKNSYRYRGYRFDQETGLYYLNSRYYYPEIGRFINSDGLLGKAGDITSTNMYAYCLNNPSSYIDYNGYEPTTFTLVSIGILAALFVLLILYVATEIGIPGADSLYNGLLGGINNLVDKLINLADKVSTEFKFSVIAIAIATATAYTQAHSSGYCVYALFDKDGVFYVGITNNYPRRLAAHRKRYGERITADSIIIGNISLAEARVYETEYILILGLPPLENRILSISNIRYNSELLMNAMESDCLLLLDMAGIPY
ncbi:MAG: GIY-YIG nuclease family protein [Firmicutes bacterium]|nr:GIY-YIG nuclease family protein [Bacillota bacterium]